jgi:hypothetical protein
LPEETEIPGAAEEQQQQQQQQQYSAYDAEKACELN